MLLLTHPYYDIIESDHKKICLSADAPGQSLILHSVRCCVVVSPIITRRCIVLYTNNFMALATARLGKMTIITHILLCRSLIILPNSTSIVPHMNNVRIRHTVKPMPNK